MAIYKDFIIGEMFDIATGRDLIIRDTIAGDIPLISHQNSNNGIVKYISPVPNRRIFNHRNTIALADRGLFYATVQSKDFHIGTRVKALTLKGDIQPREVLMFLVAVINKLQIQFTEYLVNATDKLPTLRIKLPVCVDSNGIIIKDVSKTFSKDGFIPDFEYMQERIAELEQEKVAKLEQYLIAVGLNDYEHIEEENNLLETTNTIIRKEFSFDYLFSSETGDVDLQQKDINGKGCYFINSGLENDGIKGKTDRPAKVFPKNTITIDFWGNAFYRPFEYKLATHNHVFSLSGEIIKNELVGLYLVSQMMYLRKIFSYAEMGTWNKIKVLDFSLPIKTDKDKTPILDDDCKYHKTGYIPDFDYMEKYIRAMQKVVIADVVKYKEEVISCTKKSPKKKPCKCQ